MKRTSPRLEDSTRVWLSGHFSSVNSGAEYILEAFAAVGKRFSHAIKEKFTREEKLLLLDCQNGHMLSAPVAGQSIVFGVYDSIKYDRLDEKWGVDADALKEKLREMSLPELTFLEIWCQGFWEQHDKIEIEEYIK